MPTGPSWAEARRSVTDVGALLRLRAAGTSRRGRRVTAAVLTGLTLTSVLAPAVVAEQPLTRDGVRLLLPALLLGVLLLATAAAVSAGGGRELLPREQAVAFPVSPATDHLGALLLAPLSLAWLLQAWTVLAAAAYVVRLGPALISAVVVAVLWLVTATVVAQAVAWSVEWVRRGPRGALVVRVAMGVLGAVTAALTVSGRGDEVLAHSPTGPVAAGMTSTGPGWLAAAATLLALAAVALVVGAGLAAEVGRRPVGDGVRTETAPRAARPHPRSDLAALLRADRAGIWRSTPIRRGLVVLALLPAVVAVGGGLGWADLAILPGLVASGGALLFGVNAWCLDGRGARWRESLPGDPRLVLASRALVLTEILLVAGTVTIALAAVRAGAPTPGQLSGVLCAAVVVTVQVVVTVLRWSVRSPYAVDLRSARATPAPPMVMVGYSARLAVSVTVTGLLFGLAGSVGWGWPLALAVPFLAWSGRKLAATTRAWCDPATRSRVIATVAG